MGMGDEVWILAGFELIIGLIIHVLLAKKK
jgi:uncharacterized membrane-anchored protein YhcB (DUF1043 family)